MSTLPVAAHLDIFSLVRELDSVKPHALCAAMQSYVVVFVDLETNAFLGLCFHCTHDSGHGVNLKTSARTTETAVGLISCRALTSDVFDMAPLLIVALLCITRPELTLRALQLRTLLIYPPFMYTQFIPKEFISIQLTILRANALKLPCDDEPD